MAPWQGQHAEIKSRKQSANAGSFPGDSYPWSGGILTKFNSRPQRTTVKEECSEQNQTPEA